MALIVAPVLARHVDESRRLSQCLTHDLGVREEVRVEDPLVAVGLLSTVQHVRHMLIDQPLVLDHPVCRPLRRRDDVLDFTPRFADAEDVLPDLLLIPAADVLQMVRRRHQIEVVVWQVQVSAVLHVVDSRSGANVCGVGGVSRPLATGGTSPEVEGLLLLVVALRRHDPLGSLHRPGVSWQSVDFARAQILMPAQDRCVDKDLGSDLVGDPLAEE